MLPKLFVIYLLSFWTSASAAWSSSLNTTASLAILSPLSNKFQVASSTEASRTQALLERPFFLLEGFCGQFTSVVTYVLKKKKRQQQCKFYNKWIYTVHKFSKIQYSWEQALRFPILERNRQVQHTYWVQAKPLN